ncbi:hypothetical protein K2173_026768 [Erythroxylum novogranatense]|uniref:glutathione transferase n=1 Tax=Erythroxylum novogranatense TaxID=1862640 RepID=A0AAV8TX67_9ROSI|nr:hypothetical protein K2173_026768 [Erythroxylum novogranatense]
MAQGVTLLGYWASPYTIRVKWALKLKEVEYEYVEEHLPEKSNLLLQYNPVHQKVPVLVHGGKPLAESLVIIEYIDDVWKQHPLLPQDPHERAEARFWAKFADEKVCVLLDCGGTFCFRIFVLELNGQWRYYYYCVPPIMRSFVTEGEEKATAAKEAREHLKTLEGALQGKQFFGGETIGFVDVAAGWIGIWARIVEQITNVNLIDEETMPLLAAWFAFFLELPIVKQCLPPLDRLLEHNRGFRKTLTAPST